MLFEKLRSKTVIALAGLTLGLFIMVIPLPELENPARVQLALTFAALSFWASGVVPVPPARLSDDDSARRRYSFHALPIA